ncbi:Cycloisomaltooligosaccharide glucanotransferase precursor [Streptomyces sp. YIM 130001]|uniref:family 16 glycoside hydrolase n=1 Tax=Streptomyces sp. YIM 130001 TaxID=2259644 RepID=UPI000E652DDA|nr:family 16 glycoside hydrolase [Streptomyces sp. YIM 130001]RII15639.1 Cycloisomaltooligosaccharide glucanotransferase precursor [Streptomyces sp. YIM 130001]
MNSRLFHRGRRRLTTLLAAAVAAGGLAFTTPSPAQAEDLPPQEPGVTMRVFDVQAPLEKICTLKPGQTPNADELKPNIDWSTPEDFGGFSDRFVAHALGNVHAPEAGSYDFRLTSDDGSRLYIDDQLVIDHDGTHGADEPKDGTVELTEGPHSLRIEYFDRDGEQQLTLGWKPPGAGDFAVVPDEALTTDADVVRVTAPGRKECEGTQDTPGDGLPLTEVRPDHKLTDLRPEGFEPQVTGMDWMPDGRMAVSTWGGTDNIEGEVYLLDNVTGDTGPDKVKATKVAEGLKEPMGLKVVDGKIFVSQKHELTELGDSDGDGVMEDYKTVATWPYGSNFHEFAFGLLYEDGYFYLNLSVAIDLGGATTDPQPAKDRGATIKVNRETGKVSWVAGGLRTPNGLGKGPDGELFATDNQGGWLPSSKLVHVKQDRFFNHYTNPAGPFDDKPVTDPVLWLPQNEIANSPSNPIQLDEGRFAGQMLFGDVTYGGIQRGYLEKVDGEYQGAVFRFTQGLEAGVNRISKGPDGAIYAGGLGADGNWGQEGKLKHGLQKLSPNGENAFDILAMRHKEGGFELEYTKPLSDETVEKLAERYTVEQWGYTPTAEYGGPKIGEETLKVTSAKLSDDRKKVTLAVDGLKPKRVVHVRSPRPFSSADGETLWSTEAWYTLNSMLGEQPVSNHHEAEEAHLTGSAGIDTEHAGYSGSGFVDGFGEEGASATFDVTAEKAGTYDVALRYANGGYPEKGTKSLSVYVNGEKAKQTELPDTGEWSTWSSRSEPLKLRKGANTVSYRYDPGDTGHVNLDMITVNPRGEPIQLFDGASSLANWQHPNGDTPSWPVTDDVIEVAEGDLRTKQNFQDFKLHAEFWLPELPDDVTGQDRANSGIYIQERYEIQILDSYGDDTLDNNEAGSIYLQKPPDVNAATPPETWQSYDIEFRAARFDADGKKTEDARVSVVWNGQKVHDDVAIEGPTGNGAPEGPAAGSIKLQDHDNKVRYRNVSIEPLD